MPSEVRNGSVALAFKCVYKKKDAVCHVKHTFYLTSEVGVSGSVYDVYLIIFVSDRNVL